MDAVVALLTSEPDRDWAPKEIQERLGIGYPITGLLKRGAQQGRLLANGRAKYRAKPGQEPLRPRPTANESRPNTAFFRGKVIEEFEARTEHDRLILVVGREEYSATWTEILDFVRTKPHHRKEKS